MRYLAVPCLALRPELDLRRRSRRGGRSRVFPRCGCRLGHKFANPCFNNECLGEGAAAGAAPGRTEKGKQVTRALRPSTNNS